MRVPTTNRGKPEGGERRGRDRDGDDRSAGGGRLRTVLLAVTLLALSYLVWRRVRSGGRSSGVDESKGATDRDEGRSIPIDGPDDDESTSGGSDVAAAVDPSLEEVDERVEPEIDETPAEPGEMTVSEDVAEEAGEETADETSTDETDVEASGGETADETSTDETEE